MTFAEAITELHALSDPEKATKAAAYHKAARPYLGVPVPQISALANGWRSRLDVPERTALADALWQSNIHEARVAATKLLTQARIADDKPVWHLIASWVPTFDAWAIADHVCDAGMRRLIADPSRLDEVEHWTTHPSFWVRRAALVITLPWTKQNHPKPADLAIRDRVLGWAAGYVDDREWFIQKAVAWWIRDLSKHDANRALAFLDQHGSAMKAFARAEASRFL